MLVILTPFRNAADRLASRRWALLEQTVRSVDALAGQTLHIIVDDGSPQELHHELIARHSRRNRLILQRDKPADEIQTCSGALNLGFDFLLDGGLSKFGIDEGTAVTALHSDDLIMHAHRRVEELRDACFLYSDAALYIESTGITWHWGSLAASAPALRRWFWIRSGLPYPTMTWRLGFLRQIRKRARQRFDQVGVMDERVGSGEDVDLALNSLECVIEMCLPMKRLPETTAVYRIRNDSLAATRDQRQRTKEERFVLKKHFGMIAPFQRAARLAVRPEAVFPGLMWVREPFRRLASVQVDERIKPR